MTANQRVRTRRVLLAWAISLWSFALGFSYPALAQDAAVPPHNPLQQQKQEVDQQKVRIQQERDRLNTLENKAKTNLSGLQKNIKATTGQIQANETRLKQASLKLKGLEGALTKAEAIYQQQQRGTVARLQVLQRQRVQTGWASVLLQSATLNDFLDRRYRLNKVFKADRQVLADLKVQTDKLDQQRSQVEPKKIKSMFSPSSSSPRNPTIKARPSSSSRASVV